MVESWNELTDPGGKSSCGLPAFEPNQPNEENGHARSQGQAEYPKSRGSQGRGTVAVRPGYRLVGIHEVAIQRRRCVVRVAGGVLGFELLDTGLELLVAGDECLVARRVHVVTMMIGPPGAVIEAAIQQPPPEKAVVGVVVNHHGPGPVRIEHVVNPHGPG